MKNNKRAQEKTIKVDGLFISLLFIYHKNVKHHMIQVPQTYNKMTTIVKLVFFNINVIPIITNK